MVFKNSVRTSKRTPHFTITTINWLTLFKFKPIEETLAGHGGGSLRRASKSATERILYFPRLAAAQG
jgi:hypothetical protein